MLAKRIIPCLDVANGRVVKGTRFVDLEDMGDAVELAEKYYNEGADEICFLDITATTENRKPVYDLIKKVAKKIFIPFSVGGGVKNVKDAQRILELGAEKVVIGSAAVNNPELIKELAERFGSQAVVISIDAKKANLFGSCERSSLDAKKVGNTWNQFIKGGREDSGLDVIKFAKNMERLGAGEILLNSIDQDGTKKGFDIELCNAICSAVNIPIIASSGAKDVNSFIEVFQKTDVSAALAARIFHTGELKIRDLKLLLKKKGVEMRE